MTCTSHIRDKRKDLIDSILHEIEDVTPEEMKTIQVYASTLHIAHNLKHLEVLQQSNPSRNSSKPPAV